MDERMGAFSQRMRALKQLALTVWLAARDPRMPFATRLLALAVAAYAFSPIDLIPDFIPLLGVLDDLLLVPLGVALVLRLTPLEIITDARAKAAAEAERPVSRGAAVVIVLVWIVALGGLAWAWRMRAAG